MPTFELSKHDLNVIFRALIYCQVDMEDAMDKAKSEVTKNYYNRKRSEYSHTWHELYQSLDRAEADPDKIVLEGSL